MIEDNVNKLASEAKEYADLQLKAFKLRMVDGLSSLFSNLLTFFFVVVLVLVILDIFGSFLISTLNQLLGEPWGYLIMGSLFIFLLLWVIAQRKKAFRNVFVRMFIQSFFEDEDRA